MQRGRRLWVAIALGAMTVAAGCEGVDALGPEAVDGGELRVLLSSATEDGPVAGDVADHASSVNRGRPDPDDERRRHHARSIFNQLAEQIPSFGGLYRVEPCVVAMVLTDLADADRAIPIVKGVIEPLVARHCADGIRVDAVAGTYTYKELMRIRHALHPLARIRGVLGAHIDFKANKVIVGVASAEVVDEVRAALARIGVPPGSVGVVVRSR